MFTQCFIVFIVSILEFPGILSQYMRDKSSWQSISVQISGNYQTYLDNRLRQAHNPSHIQLKKITIMTQ